MYCQNCGTKNADDAFYCENCGEALEIIETQDSPFMTSNPTAVKKPFSKLMFVIAVELATIILLIYGVVSCGKNLFSAKHEAENFFVCMKNGDFQKAYGKLDVIESDFINEQMFEKAMAYSRVQIVDNYQIQKNIDGIINQADLLAEEISIQYQAEGSNFEYPITLNKQKDKKYVLFDYWKVDAGRLICKEYMIYVPKGAKVVVDGLALHDQYVLADNMAENQSMSAMDVYQIPEIFYGSHNITVSMEDMEDVTETVQITQAGQVYQLSAMHMKKEAARELIWIAGKNMQSIYHAALCGQDFHTIVSIFTASEEMLSQIQESYDYLVSDLQENSSKPYSIQFYHINGKVSSADSSSLQISFSYDLAYTYEDWWSGDRKKDVYSGSQELTFDFRKENGKWVQGNLGCESLYY